MTGGIKHIKKFRPEQTLAVNTEYFATCDGIVEALSGGSSLSFLRDDTPTPTTLRQYAEANNTLVGVIRKGTYWKIYSVGTATIFFTENR